MTTVSVYDELLAGILSKAKGQILRVSACLNVFFSDQEIDHNNATIKVSPHVPLVITEDAIIAAQNIVDMACQHCMLLAGKRSIEEELKRFSTG
jgi:hypothetical protein